MKIKVALEADSNLLEVAKSREKERIANWDFGESNWNFFRLWFMYKIFEFNVKITYIKYEII